MELKSQMEQQGPSLHPGASSLRLRRLCRFIFRKVPDKETLNEISLMSLVFFFFYQHSHLGIQLLSNHGSSEKSKVLRSNQPRSGQLTAILLSLPYIGHIWSGEYYRYCSIASLQPSTFES